MIGGTVRARKRVGRKAPVAENGYKNPGELEARRPTCIVGTKRKSAQLFSGTSYLGPSRRMTPFRAFEPEVYEAGLGRMQSKPVPIEPLTQPGIARDKWACCSRACLTVISAT